MTAKSGRGNQTVTLEVPEELIKSAELYSELTGIDKGTALFRWLQAGAEREMLQLVSDGELSTGKFVEVMGITYFDVHPLTQKYRIEIGPTEEQIQYMWDHHADAVGKILRDSRRCADKEQQ